MKTATIIWIIVGIIVLALLGWWAWGYLYPSTPSTNGYGAPSSNAGQIGSSADLSAASQSLDSTNLNDIDAGLNANAQDQSSFQ